MPREVCSQCEYILKRCICESLVKIDNSIPILIIQAPKEKEHPFNTVKILKKCIKKIHIIESYEFNLNEYMFLNNFSRPLLIYPKNKPDLLIEYNTNKIEIVDIDLLIFIDGTWDKSKRIYLNNLELQKIKSAKLINFPTLYEIRKTNINSSLSTLETVAYTLSACNNKDSLELLGPLKFMVELQKKHLPKT